MKMEIQLHWTMSTGKDVHGELAWVESWYAEEDWLYIITHMSSLSYNERDQMGPGVPSPNVGVLILHHSRSNISPDWKVNIRFLWKAVSVLQVMTIKAFQLHRLQLFLACVQSGTYCFVLFPTSHSVVLNKSISVVKSVVQTEAPSSKTKFMEMVDFV